MNGKTTQAVVILLLVLVTVGCVQALTISVAPAGGDYSNVQQALDAASPGDEIMVAAGTYPGGVMVNVPVTLSGKDRATVGSNADTVALYVNADGVVIRNLSCTASGAGIIANETDGLQADGCRVISGDIGILFTGCSNSAITSTEVTAKRTGIEVASCNVTAVSGSRVSANSVGITIKGSADATVEDTSILGAEIGILMENSGGCRANDVTFAGIGGAVLGIGAHACTITGSAFTDVTQYIQFYAASGCRVEAPSLEGPAFFAADIFSDTEYRCGPYSIRGRDYGFLYDSYEAPEGYQRYGDAMNITFITAAESPNPPMATITADLPVKTAGMIRNTYGLYRTDGATPILVSVPEVSDSGVQTLQMNMTEPGHIVLMARAEPEETPYYDIFLWAVVVLGVLLLLVVWRKR